MFKADAVNFTLIGRADMESLQPNKTVVDCTAWAGLPVAAARAAAAARRSDHNGGLRNDESGCHAQVCAGM